MRLHPTRGYYDLTGVEGAAGPVQLFGMLAAGACVAVAALTFGHGPFTAWGFSVLLLAHGTALGLRRGDPSLATRVSSGFALMLAVCIATAATPGLRDAAYTPDMQSDSDYFIGGLMVWISLAAQCFAATPGVLLFALVPELAALAVFGQMNVGPEMPACYCVYLIAALGLLSYASFLRRPHGAPPPRRRVVPAPHEMAFGVAVLFALLATGGGLVAVGLRLALPSPLSARWFQRGLLNQLDPRPQPYEQFGNTLSLRRNSGPLASAPVLSVRAPRPVLLRRRVYSRYTGDAWVPRVRTSRVMALTSSGAVPEDVIEGVPRGAEQLECALTPIREIDTPLPVAGMPVAISGLGSRPTSVTYFGTVEFQGPVDAGSPVRVKSLERLGEAGRLDECGADYPEYLFDEGYFDLTPGVLELSASAQAIAAEEPTVAAKVAALERYVERECVYNLSAPPPAGGMDSVVDFLTRRKQGTCADFASALAMLCRLNGIPSRIVTGYAAADPDPNEPGYYVVREKDAHAWVEVYYASVGWVTYDPQADRAIEGTPLDRALVHLRNTAHALALVGRRYLATIVGAVPLAYIVLYELRRRGRRWKACSRQGAGQVLRRLLASLEPWAPWAMPGRAPWETVGEALKRLPEEHHAPLCQCMESLLELRYGAREPDAERLARATRQAKELRQQLRRVRAEARR
jgi:hypothetical protein